MLRYFYILLCLLVCLERVFCYSFSSDNGNYHNVKRLGKVRNRRHRIDERGRSVRHQDYDSLENDQLAEIDVASFIQKPDYDPVDELGPFAEARAAPHAKPYYADYGSTNEINIDSNSRISRASTIKPSYSFHLENLDLPASKYGKDPGAVENSPPKKQEKKSAMSKLKLPFFSYKKSEKSSQAGPKQKQNKRKLFDLKRKISKSSTKAAPNARDHEPTYEAIYTYDFPKRKRSFMDKMCPLCKRKMPSKEPPKMIHNSRQYYSEYMANQEVPDFGNNFDSKDSTAVDKRDKRQSANSNANANANANAEYKMEKQKEKDRESARLRELEDVERKVQNFVIPIEAPTTPARQPPPM